MHPWARHKCTGPAHVIVNCVCMFLCCESGRLFFLPHCLWTGNDLFIKHHPSAVQIGASPATQHWTSVFCLEFVWKICLRSRDSLRCLVTCDCCCVQGSIAGSHLWKWGNYLLSQFFCFLFFCIRSAVSDAEVECCQELDGALQVLCCSPQLHDGGEYLLWPRLSSLHVSQGAVLEHVVNCLFCCLAVTWAV